VFALAGVGMYATKKYKTNFAELLALGSLMHIALDQVWRVQGTLFWPLFGLEFPKFNLEDYAGYIFYVLTHNPDAYVPEIIGIGILLTFIYYFKMYKPENIKAFLNNGRLTVHKQVIGIAID
jgi:hypothetical protein